METLLSDAYNADRRKLIDRSTASLEQRPGKIDGYGGVVKLRRADGARAARGGERRRRADGRPRRPDDAATPCTSTSSTGTAT